MEIEKDDASKAEGESDSARVEQHPWRYLAQIFSSLSRSVVISTDLLCSAPKWPNALH